MSFGKCVLGAGLLLTLVYLSGCVSENQRSLQTTWVKPNATAADLERDRNACLYDAHKAAPYAAPNSLPVLNLAIECLKSKGWALVPIGQ
jgi:outer membrane murein-binding lipoprotein Lpp